MGKKSKANKKILIVGNKELGSSLERVLKFVFGYGLEIKDIFLDLKLEDYNFIILANSPGAMDEKRYKMYALPYFAVYTINVKGVLVVGWNNDEVFKDGWSDLGGFVKKLIPPFPLDELKIRQQRKSVKRNICIKDTKLSQLLEKEIFHHLKYYHIPEWILDILQIIDPQKHNKIVQIIRSLKC